MKTNTPSCLWTLAKIPVLFLYVACNKNLTLRYQYDPFEEVESATAYYGETICATAKRIQERHVGDTGGATVTDIDVEEIQFAPNSQAVVYKGRVVFRCITNQEFCERVSVTPILGKRQRDIFRKWPYARTPLY
jgi:hypothetical protein